MTKRPENKDLDIVAFLLDTSSSSRAKMDWLHFSQLVSLGCLLLLQAAWCQEMKECKKSGDYLWKKKSPEKFYFCYRVGYSMPMECTDSKYMCKVPGKVFAPCMCDRNNPGVVAYDECTEKFRRSANTYRTGGELISQATTLERCEDFCLKAVHCLGFDYHLNPRECRVFWPKQGMSELEPIQGVDHYIKRPCALKSGYKHRVLNTHEQDVTASTTQEPGGIPKSYTKKESTPGKEVEGKEVKGDAYGAPYTPPPLGSDYDTGGTTTQSSAPATTTTIPDSGCPFGLKKYEDISHRGGVLLKHISNLEGCKNWCLNVGYCKGIDYDTDLNLCYYHRVIDEDAISEAPNVIHVRKEACQPPLKCWSQISYNSSNVDPSTPQIPCQGVCFVREKIFNNYSVFERGCHASEPPHKVGCEVESSLTGVNCFCDTDRCNGLSILALAAVMLHLPLDGDLHDHSGLGRHGQTSLGYQMPETSCLEKAINCSMVFNGQQCIEVPQMASQALGDVNLNNEFTAMFTVSVWFKAAEKEEAVVQGIVGNSWDADTDPTWAIRTSSISPNVVDAGVNTKETEPFEPDFPYIVAATNEWHHIAVTYDSTFDIDTGVFPILKVYLDGINVPGNMHSDMGNILVRRQPVTVGCVMGDAFMGCIDDVRIFAMALDIADIEALRQMNDGLYQ